MTRRAGREPHLRKLTRQNTTRLGVNIIDCFKQFGAKTRIPRQGDSGICSGSYMLSREAGDTGVGGREGNCIDASRTDPFLAFRSRTGS